MIEAVLTKLASESRKAYAVALGALLVVSAELACLIAITGCPTLSAMAWDAGIMLDGGFRLLHGLKPHVDFYSPLGLLPLGLVAAGLKIGAPSAAAFAHIHAILLPLLAVWAWLLLRVRTSAILAGLMALWVGVTAVAPRCLGDMPTALTYAMQYNRWGWSLLLLACIESLLPRRRPGFSAWEALSTGAIASLLLFLKINYFFAVVLAVAFRLVVHGVDRRWISAAAASFAAVAATGFAYLNFDFTAFLADLRLLASVHTVSARLGSVAELTFGNLFQLWPLACLLLLAAGYAAPAGAGWRGRLGLLGTPAALAGLGIVTCSANCEKFEIPLISFAVFVAAEGLRRGLENRGEHPRAVCLAAVLIAIGTVGSTLYLDLAALVAANGTRSAVTASAGWPKFEAAALSGMTVAPPPDLVSQPAVEAALEAGAVPFGMRDGESYPYVLWFNDGARLLRDHISHSARLLVMDFFNPFTFPLALTPPRGDALFWHESRNFDERHFPAAARVFREITHVMVPKTPIVRPSTLVMRRIYAPVLAGEFRPLAESRLWTLYERRGQGSGAAGSLTAASMR